ncbi:MAG: hypothetical protein KJZ90_04885 [Rhodocyclaceae bacterium]|nr:hypothetical protein [Rhodocyclaceae bacterium]
MKIKTLSAALLFSALSLPALAQVASTPRIDQRQANQQQRIEQGVQSGALTQQEAARLQHGQRIEHAQDVQSKRVYRQKHDRQHDFNHDGRMDRPARRK